MQTLIHLYYSLVFPDRIYCNAVWGHANNIYIDSLVKLQKKIIRIITHSYYNAHAEPLFRQLNILDFHKLVIQRTALMMLKYSSNNLLSPIRTMLIKTLETELHYMNLWAQLKPLMQHLDFMEFTFGTYFLKKYLHMFHIHVLNIF